MINRKVIKTQRKRPIRICPNCKKSTLELYAGFETGSYICKQCGYLGPIVLYEER